MAEQAAVNREVVGSSPTGAAINCRMDVSCVALTLNQREIGFSIMETLREQPQLLHPMPCGVTGNISLFESEDSRFKSWRGSWEVSESILCTPPFSYSCSPIGRGGCLKTSDVQVQILSGVPINHTAVAQSEEVLVLETRGCGFKSHSSVARIGM